MSEYIEASLYKGKTKIKFYPGSHRYYVDGKIRSSVTGIIGIKDKSVALVSWATELGAENLVDKLNAGKKITEEDILYACYLHTERKEQAADTGSQIHDWCEKYIKHKLKTKGYEMPEMPENQNVIIGINAFLDWEKEHKVKFVSSERLVYSKKYDYMGKMDIEAIIDKDLVLIDLKSSNGLYNPVLMQTAAYVKADEEESGRNYKGRWAIRLSKETESEYLARMERKNAWRQKRGKESNEIKPYQVFEAKYLDAEDMNIERDFKAFLNCLGLFRWDAQTDFYRNK